jgi:hypothetical protein
VGLKVRQFPLLRSTSKGFRRAGFRTVGVFATLLFACTFVSAQEHTLGKVPGASKITNPASRLAFTGTVQSLNEKQKTLNVNSVEGGATEIFPIKKSTSVIGSGGSRLKLTDLKPGTNIIVYFEQRTDHRSVQRVEVIGAEPKAQAPPS